MTVRPQLLFTFGTQLIPSKLVWVEIECTEPVALPKLPINRFRHIGHTSPQRASVPWGASVPETFIPVRKSRKEALNTLLS